MCSEFGSLIKNKNLIVLLNNLRVEPRNRNILKTEIHDFFWSPKLKFPFIGISVQNENPGQPREFLLVDFQNDSRPSIVNIDMDKKMALLFVYDGHRVILLTDFALNFLKIVMNAGLRFFLFRFLCHPFLNTAQVHRTNRAALAEGQKGIFLSFLLIADSAPEKRALAGNLLTRFKRRNFS